ncbi:MAG: DUF799 family lipoprotein [Deltaproteobacteria bacterium]|nr:DUF799 family lipoprotein [Deltaproteobacteria bacterium]
MSRRGHGRFILTLAVILLIAGCTAKIPYKLLPDYRDRHVRLVAVMPVLAGKAADAMAAEMFRRKTVEGLYFKGYPRIPLNLIDGKLDSVYRNNPMSKNSIIPPRIPGELLGVDAALYVVLDECRTSFAPLFATTALSVKFELRSAKTGETLWQTQYSTKERNYALSRKGLEMESSQIFEPVIEGVINRVMETLPDGPDALK